MAETRHAEGRQPTLSASLRTASRWWILIAGGLLFIGALREAAVVFMPIVLGLVMAMLLAPVAGVLDRIMWRWLACLLALAVPLLFVGLTALFWVYAGRQVMDRAGAFSLERAVEQLARARDRAVDLGLPETVLLGAAEEDNGDGDTTSDAEANGGDEATESSDRSAAANGPWSTAAERALSVVLGGLRTALSGLVALGLAFAFAYFALWEAPRWRRWVESWNGRSRSEYTLMVAGRGSRLVQRYLLAKLVTGLAAGLATWLWLLAMDVPLAFVWGGLTFLLNFIPSVGALLSGIPPTVLALTELGLAEAMMVAAGLVVIEAITAQVVEPLLQADFLEVSPFVMVASLLFWAWLWGAVGAVLAPILTAGAINAMQHLRIDPPDGAQRPRRKRKARWPRRG